MRHLWLPHNYRLSIPFWSDFILPKFDSKYKILLQTFNPILVWFYRVPPSIFSSFLSFNPILVWFYQQDVTYRMQQCFFLSIPFWSDFIQHLPVMLLISTVIFQSHFGLILSQLHENPFVHRVCFQSHFGLILSTSQTINFNSIFVFQSHFGLILSRAIGYTWDRHHRSFNPILVWFYQPDNCTDFQEARNFQSHFGLILSLLPSATLRITRLIFQSHFGLILSLIPYTRIVKSPNSFNPILVWFYHSRNLSIQKWSTKAFNPILVWFYLSKNVVSTSLIRQLSIPFWSDFIENASRLACWAFVLFQSHFGLILSRQITTQWYLKLYTWQSFNPILVWFYQW